MTTAVYIASSEGGVGKSTIALGLVEALARTVNSVGVFRPLVKHADDDIVTRTLIAQEAVPQSYDDAIGIDYAEFAADPDEAMTTIVNRYETLRKKYDALVIVGSDYADVSAPIEMNFNARVAANLNAPVLLAVRGKNRTVDEVRRSAEVGLAEFERLHNSIFAVIATRIAPELSDEARIALAGIRGDLVTGVLPETNLLAAPTVEMQVDALGADLWIGSQRELSKESLGITVAGMTLPNLLNRMQPDHTVVMPADRVDLLPGLVLAHRSQSFPDLAAVVLTGGYEIPANVRTLMNSIDARLPICTVQETTYETAQRLSRLEGTRTSSPRKMEISRKLFADNINGAQLLDSLARHGSELRTPLMFENQIMSMARSDVRTIVLPESQDDRILESAAIILERNVAQIVLLGDSLTINKRARKLKIDLSKARIIDPTDDELLNKFAGEYAKLRAKKGVTFEQAKEKLADPSYFGTMLVHFGMADGMVSGAVNTTANTIRPSLEFIKTKPGIKVVSSSFLMCMPDRVLVFGDCAVNPNPTPEQLADIAISSADTAKSFGIEPKVAMLSYSTGESGSGPDVDAVREATELVKQARPDLVVEGPIQFDAAIDPTVGQKKMPGSPVAGQATVFVFPDLNTGNNTYKAVQRTSGAIAVGPALQGLNCAVNDLSRGATVDDIVSTVAITAIQAQERPAGAGSPLREA
ncbi:MULTISPECIES: phosphate acetyltransferase [unclassified Luteococcus]|uniref:phosphate acetyltransferase n=1 Tax=unclassified Luteococcus TaxID=2639923 RepID=UPI00313C17B6